MFGNGGIRCIRQSRLTQTAGSSQKRHFIGCNEREKAVDGEFADFLLGQVGADG
jgi:hypothetical protein